MTDDDQIHPEHDAYLNAAFAAASEAINPNPQYDHSRGPPSSTSSTLFTLQTLKGAHIRASSPASPPRRVQVIPPVIPYIDPTSPFPHASAYPYLHFPLAPDHYLITLIQYNVLRALMTNFLLVNVSIPPECQNAFRIPLLHYPPATPPPTFASTAMQRSVKHDSWIDSVPCPTLRDNLILASTDARWDSDDLCDDICGGLYEGFDECETRGMLVWGDPWLVESWEVSPGFAAKWGVLLRGCGEMMGHTNRWRESRGEEPLVFEID